MGQRCQGGHGRVGKCRGQEAGEGPGGHGGIRVAEGCRKGCRGQEARMRVMGSCPGIEY